MMSWLLMMFWVSVAGIAYAYIVFPALAVFACAVKKERFGTPLSRPATMVTVIVPAYNEETSIADKIRNTLESAYPGHLLEVIVVSDASSDNTDAIVRSFEPAGVRLIVQAQRRGKSAGLNRAVAAARGEVVVFTDANAWYPADAIAGLERYLTVPGVGLVSGYTRYTKTSVGAISQATNLYTSLERTIKKAESAWGCSVSADGAIFAMRRRLYRALRDDDINDMVIPLGVIDQGYRCVFADDIFCNESPGQNLESEFRRQSRITNRTLRALWRHAHLFNPIRFPALSWFVLSHKVARFLVPVFLVLATGALVTIALGAGGIYSILGVLLVVAIIVAALPKGKRAPFLEHIRIISLFKVFVTINVAVLNGWWRFLAGQGDTVWQHDRPSA
jgi:cellulose synthase/poly-beta-1,6-N-acetylglucosamine synthase-like glycosyltransferase